MKIAFIHYGSKDNPRAAKICQSLLNAGHTVIFVGWERNPEQPERLLVPASQYLIMNRPVLGGAPSLGSLWHFSNHVVKALYMHRPDVVHCVNEETAALVLPFKHVLFQRLVCDVFDGLADRVPSSRRLLHGILRFIRAVVYAMSDRIVVTDERRYDRLASFKSKAIIVENTPVDPGSDLALRFPEGETKVLFSGNVIKTRGCDVIMAALDQAPDVTILAAGLLDEFAEQTFIHHRQVTYLGVLTSRESLDVLARCDAVLAFYEPTSSR